MIRLCKIFAGQGFKVQMMKKDRIRWLFAIGLLGLLGFSSCSPRLRPRRASTSDLDSVRVIPIPDTSGFFRPLPNPNPGDMPPAKLMYGVPPGQFKRIDLENKETNKTEKR